MNFFDRFKILVYEKLALLIQQFLVQEKKYSQILCTKTISSSEPNIMILKPIDEEKCENHMFIFFFELNGTFGNYLKAF